jgi:hypothetical protein
LASDESGLTGIQEIQRGPVLAECTYPFEYSKLRRDNSFGLLELNPLIPAWMTFFGQDTQFFLLPSRLDFCVLEKPDCSFSVAYFVGLIGTRFVDRGDSLCATISETTPSERLVYNRGRGKDGPCLIVNQLRPIQPRGPSSSTRACSTSGSTAHAAGWPRSAGERHRLGDGGALLLHYRMLTP